MKNVFFLIKVINGGGAERVVSLLANYLTQCNYYVTLILTHQSLSSAQYQYLHPKVHIISLDDLKTEEYSRLSRIIISLTKLLCRRVFKKKHSAIRYKLLICKYQARNYGKLKYLKRLLKKNNNSTVIAFLYDSIFYSLLSTNNKNKLIISERSDPEQTLSNEINAAFIYTMFNKADKMIFQSPDVMKWYRENTNIKGKVIFNPVKPDLPERYVGERKKKIVNFCRISPPKKLDTLIEAFDEFEKLHNDYELFIYGNADEASPDYLDYVKEKIDSAQYKDKIYLLPALRDIHKEIVDYSMFVSSSCFEGMSNSMLEAMAIGLPTICTDCPAGGARAIIKNHDNGILVPVNDADAMCQAMCEVADNYELAEKLSINATKIREELAVDKIVKQWMEFIDD